jgi:diguanylate cyclase (GGDEF)-like protein/PAS domain S-box-containing protein
MNPKNRNKLFDHIGLIIIGAGVSAFYLYFEKALQESPGLTVFITVGIILMISVLTQILINNINRSKEALAIANETLEQKVKERTEELRASETKYRTIFENTGAATIISESDDTISLANTEFLSISGYSKEALEDRKPWLDFIDEKSRRKIVHMKSAAWNNPVLDLEPRLIESEFIDRDGAVRDVLITLAAIPDTGKSVISLTDISELKEAERQIYHQAFHDALTSLPNRALFMEHLRMAIKRTHRRRDYNFAVLYLDIDRFKNVNDSLGHSVGDKLLMSFAERIQDSLRDIDTLSRFGGDEFVILLEDIESISFASNVAERLQQTLEQPFHIDGKEIYAPASFGLVANTRDYDQPEAIIRDADAAMYHAKETGKAKFKIFDKKLHERAIHLLQRETDLRKAIEENQFVTYYQPIVHLETAALVGFEVLIRWQHPSLGIMYPNSFISIAEETGLIIPITSLIVERSCQDLKSWQETVGDTLTLSMNVNISSKHFMLPSLLDDIKNVLVDTGLPPEQLKLEITETALMEDADDTIELVHRLKNYGLKLVIDDFGTGYSSLSYLQRLPIDTLKVDRSFVSQITSLKEDNRNIVEAIISLAHRLKMLVVAEGVETPEQYAILRSLRCEYGQGYLFSRPIPKREVDQLIGSIADFGRTFPNRPYALTNCLSKPPVPPDAMPAQLPSLQSEGGAI